MPYVNIRITREGATSEQKRQLIRGATDLLVGRVRVAGHQPALCEGAERDTHCLRTDAVQLGQAARGRRTVAVQSGQHRGLRQRRLADDMALPQPAHHPAERDPHVGTGLEQLRADPIHHDRQHTLINLC